MRAHPHIFNNWTTPSNWFLFYSENKKKTKQNIIMSFLYFASFFLLWIMLIVQYGEFDCWKLECPPLTCSNPLPLAPGDCCPRCEDDPCNYLINSNNTHGLAEKPCTYKGDTYASGEKFSDTSSQCTTCACKVISPEHRSLCICI